MSATVVPWYLMAIVKSGKTYSKGRSASGFAPSQFAELIHGVESFDGWIIITGGFDSVSISSLLLVNTSFITAGKKVLPKIICVKTHHSQHRAILGNTLEG